jgi:hypothetical protein
MLVEPFICWTQGLFFFLTQAKQRPAHIFFAEEGSIHGANSLAAILGSEFAIAVRTATNPITAKEPRKRIGLAAIRSGCRGNDPIKFWVTAIILRFYILTVHKAGAKPDIKYRR